MAQFLGTKSGPHFLGFDQSSDHFWDSRATANEDTRQCAAPLASMMPWASCSLDSLNIFARDSAGNFRGAGGWARHPHSLTADSGNGAERWKKGLDTITLHSWHQRIRLNCKIIFEFRLH